MAVPWAALASAAANALPSLIGAGAEGYAAYKNSKASQDIADQADPARVAALNAQYNNINRYTPFGAVEYQLDEGRRDDPSDDRWSMQQSYSPQMQQLMDAMMGQAGRAPATYSSQMPSGLRDRMSDVYGSDVPESSYSAPVHGFGQNRRPNAGQVKEGFRPDLFTVGGQRNDTPWKPYEPPMGGMGGPSMGGDPTTDALLDITPGQTTNDQILNQLYDQGYISDYDHYALNDYWQKKGSGKGNRFGWSQAQSEDDLAEWMPDNLHHRLLNSWDNVKSALFAYNPNYQSRTEPPPENVEPDAMSALANALQGVQG